MGKAPYMYTDSDETEDTCSSAENVKTKAKNKFSILKYTNGNVKKKKCKVHSVSEPEEAGVRGGSCQRVRKLRGILKHDRDRESSEDDEDLDMSPPRARDKYLVGRVPRPAGTRPGRGGGLAILIRKNIDMAPLQSLQAQPSMSSTKRCRHKRRTRKQSY